MKLSADYIFTGEGEILTNTAIEVNDKGKIIQIESLSKDEDIKYFDGIIVPGFFNSHLHLEFAGSKFYKSNGIIDFINNIKKINNNSKINNELDIKNLDEQLYKQGVVFCGDISNTTKTIDIKKQSSIEYYNFIEIFETLADNSKKKFDNVFEISDEFKKNYLQTNLVPHSLYSISNELTNCFHHYNDENQAITSIHFKESYKENDINNLQKEIYNPKNEAELEIFNKKFHNDDLLSRLKKLFSKNQKILFVHNIYITLKEAKEIFNMFNNCALCICPSSNINIENKMISSEIVKSYLDKILLGTDSLISNKEMSLIKEMYLFQQNYNLNFEEILKAVTTNPAKFFNKENKFGKIKKGYSSGLVNIKNFNINKMQLTKDSISINCFI